MPEGTVTSYTLLGKEWVITKAYDKPDGSVAIEGWISTPMKDMEKDILEPEAFAGEGFSNYFSKGAPISSEHNTKAYPVGYLVKSVLVRNGVIIQQEDNPLHDKTEFLDFNGMGVGWYGLGSIYDPQAALNVRKGTVRSFSWIGHPKAWDEIDGGGRHFKQSGAINPLLEATITAYPINQAAIMRIAKAHGYTVEPPKLYSLPMEALVDIFVNSRRNRESMHSAVERAFERKG